jgi:hypothetical protein
VSFLQLLKDLWQKFTDAKQVGLPTIAAAALAQAKADDWDYLSVFLEAYRQSVRPKLLQDSLSSLSNEQCILLVYSDLYDQVTNGGFIQLIQNGYGRNLFDNPFAEDIAKWGATQLADLVAQANIIYKAHREYLERQRTIPEFSQLYQEFKEFGPLEDSFYTIIDGQTTIIRAYIAQHLHQFAIIE